MEKFYIFDIFFIIIDLRKTFIVAKFYISSLFTVAAIKILFKNKISIIVFIVDYSKNIKTKYSFCN